jgi:hypothetical protein
MKQICPTLASAVIFLLLSFGIKAKTYQAKMIQKRSDFTWPDGKKMADAVRS